MNFLVLGHISVARADGTIIGLPSVSQRRLVGFLASRANTIVPVATVGHHLDLTDGAVRTGIARLRRRLGRSGSALVTEGPGYRLATDGVDAMRFEHAVRAALARGVEEADARRTLEHALRMWRGEAYAEFAHEHWAAAEAARLNELRATATESLVDVLLALGDPEAALELAASLTERHPFRDRPRGQQMRALAAMGRVTESLRSFQAYRSLLLGEVGTLPSTALVELEQLIATGGLPAGDVRTHPQSRQPTPAKVREVELPRNAEFGLDGISRRVAAELAAGDLVTLTGVGGVGKTRLALRVVSRTAAEYDRVAFVDLRQATSREGVVAAAGRALGVDTSAPAVIVQALHRCRTLLVLDNCEHVLEAAAELTHDVLAGPGDVRVLATSRLPLGITGEHVCAVPVLSPDDARDLFVSRASKWRDDFGADDPAVRDLVTKISVRLDRIPLALELAAACVAHMTLMEIAAQLDHRLTFLPGDPTRLQQQRTLRGTMDWSYGLLDDELQSLLRALSVFAWWFDASAAAAVWGRSLADTLAGLGALVRASLLVARPDGDVMRYQLLETVRLLAEEKASAAGETVELRSAHADHYAAGLEAIDPIELLRPASARRPDIANHERVLEWVASGEDLRRLGALAWRVAMAHRAECWTDPSGRYLGRDDVMAVLSEQERACYLAASFENANILGRWEDQLRFADRGLESASGPVRVSLLRGAATACHVLAPQRVAGLVAEATALVDPADIDVYLELRRAKADSLLLAGDLESAAGELRSLWAEVLAAPIETGSIRPLAGIELVWVSLVLGRDDEAASLADVLCDVPGGQVAGWSARSIAAARRLRRAESARHLLAAADAAESQRVPLVDNDVAVVAAVRAVALGDPERACRLLASITGGVRSPGSHQLLRHARRLVRDHLPPESIDAIRTEMSGVDPASVTGAEFRRLRAEA